MKFNCSQHWHITKDHLLRNDDVCIQASNENASDNLARLEKCNGNVKEQVTSCIHCFKEISNLERAIYLCKQVEPV